MPKHLFTVLTFSLSYRLLGLWSNGGSAAKIEHTDTQISTQSTRKDRKGRYIEHEEEKNEAFVTEGKIS